MPDPHRAARSPSLASALYTGWVRHRRYGPKAHHFRYRLFMAYLDLAEIEEVMALSRCWSTGRRNLAEFRRSDYLAPHDRDLDAVVRDGVEARTGTRPDGPVRMLTHLRYFGYCFNPVTFYYAWHRGTLHTILAEITNTPWRERHRYVLPVAAARPARGAYAFEFAKDFHVSPFLDMDMQYLWRLSEPDDRLLVHMENSDPHGALTFDATLVLDRRPLSSRAMNQALVQFPLMTTRVIAGIHWQALRLWLKGNPVYDHPSGQHGNAPR